MALVSQSGDAANMVVTPGQQLIVGNGASQRVLNGDEKAAALLLALGPDYGKPIFA
jgi:flagellar motor switch protein FliG